MNAPFLAAIVLLFEAVVSGGDMAGPFSLALYRDARFISSWEAVNAEASMATFTREDGRHPMTGTATAGPIGIHLERSVSDRALFVIRGADATRGAVEIGAVHIGAVRDDLYSFDGSGDLIVNAEAILVARSDDGTDAPGENDTTGAIEVPRDESDGTPPASEGSVDGSSDTDTGGDGEYRIVRHGSTVVFSHSGSGTLVVLSGTFE